VVLPLLVPGDAHRIVVGASAATRTPALDLADGDGWSVASGLLVRGAQFAERRVGDAVGFEAQGGGVVVVEAFEEVLRRECAATGGAGFDARRSVGLVAERGDFAAAARHRAPLGFPLPGDMLADCRSSSNATASSLIGSLSGLCRWATQSRQTLLGPCRVPALSLSMPCSTSGPVGVVRAARAVTR
jgi:hypothetical protein